MLDDHSVIQVYSLVFGAILVAAISAVFKLMFDISASIKQLTEKTTKALTRMDYHDETLGELKSRILVVEKKGCNLAKQGQCILTS